MIDDSRYNRADQATYRHSREGGKRPHNQLSHQAHFESLTQS